MDPFIRVTHLHKEFSGRPVLADINLEVAKGDFVSLVGPSGCGKSTLLRLLSGLETPSSGEVRVGNKIIHIVPPQKRNIGFVFQHYALFPHQTAFQNIAFGLEVRGYKKETIRQNVTELLEKMNLVAVAHKHVSTLSGGEQQRTALARALIIQPELMLFDEPLSNLDASMRETARKEIKRTHQETKTTSIYVTHDQEDALALSDWVIVLAKGKVQQIGTPEQVYQHPANTFVAEFIGKANIFSSEVSSRLGFSDYGKGLSFAVLPENLQVIKNPAGQGQVAQKNYQGNSTEIIVAFEGKEFRSRCRNNDPVYNVGEKVTLEVLDHRYIAL